MFAKHHYLAHSFNKAADVFLLILNDKLCGFSAALTFPHPIRKNVYRAHRTVILPDYQGIGLSKIFRNCIGDFYFKKGKELITTTSSPALIASMKNDKHWKCVRKSRIANIKNSLTSKTNSSNRITTAWEYIN